MENKNYVICSDAIDAVNDGRSIPTYVHGHDFKLSYHATDGWRGYQVVTPTKKSRWTKVDESWVTGNWSDAGENAADAQEARMDKLAAELAAQGKEMIVVCTPTSNVFSTAMDVFSRDIIQK